MKNERLRRFHWLPLHGEDCIVRVQEIFSAFPFLWGVDLEDDDGTSLSQHSLHTGYHLIPRALNVNFHKINFFTEILIQ